MILVPPTTLRRDTAELFCYDRERDWDYIRREWECQYVLGGFRPTLVQDEVWMGTWIVLAAIFLDIPLIEVYLDETA